MNLVYETQMKISIFQYTTEWNPNNYLIELK